MGNSRVVQKFVVLLLTVVLLSAICFIGIAGAAGSNLVGPGSGCTYSASSFRTGYEPDKAFDGDISTAWWGDTTPPYNQQWLQAAFPAPTDFNTIKLSEYYDGGYPRTGSYAIGWSRCPVVECGNAYTGYIIAEQPNKTTITFPTVTGATRLWIGYTSTYSGNPYNPDSPLAYEFEVYNNTEQPRTLTAGCLLDDYNLTSLTADTTPTGWNKDEAGGVGGSRVYNGGGISPTSNDSFEVLYDNNSSQGVKFWKEFLPQVTGTGGSIITCEFRFQLPYAVFNDAFLKLKYGTTDVVVLKTANNGTLYYDNGTLTSLGAISAGAWHGVKLIANLATKQVTTIYVDGVKKLSTAKSFKDTSAAYIDTFSAETGDAISNVEMWLGKVKIHKGYQINEDLATTIPGMSAPINDWIKDGYSGTAAVVEEIANSPFDKNVVRLSDTNGTQSLTFTKTNATALSGSLIYEYKFMVPTKKNGLCADLLSGTTLAMRIITAGSSDALGDIKYVNSSGSQVTLITNYKANLWYYIKAELNVVGSGGADTVTYFVNGRKITPSPVPTRSNIDSINKARFMTTPTSVQVNPWYVDDIVFGVQEPYANVPTVTPATTGDYWVGAQVGLDWREGSTGIGWQQIVPYPDRKPRIGWYDEGDPEITDWEIKYALEHGINHFMYCWLRIGDTSLKDPYDVDYLHKGLFNSKLFHNNNMKFSIIWVDSMYFGAPPTTAEVMNNLVPYWIEYYFKNPNYLKTSDNRPIMAVYDIDWLITTLGSTTAVADLFNQMRAAVDAEPGLGPLIIIVEYRWDNPSEIQKRFDCGADYIYAYCWHPPYVNTDDATMLGIVENRLTNQKTYSSNRAIPTVGMGWDSTPYDGPGGATYRFHPASFMSLADWVKNSFDPVDIDPGTGIMKLVLLDNWNEWGEGHYIAPCDPGTNYPASDFWHQFYSFGYLDATRNIFASPSAHEDVIPLDVTPGGATGPYDLLSRKWWSY